jgi:hypothetical protein
MSAMPRTARIAAGVLGTALALTACTTPDRPPGDVGSWSDEPTDSQLAALAQAPSDEAEQFYFVMTDRFADGDASNNTGGLDGDALADRLIRNAARATAGVGAAGGGVAAVEWAVTPTLLSAPVLLAAETVAVVAIEIKLIGELHEAYGVPVPGSSSQRAGAMIQSWATRRGVNPFLPGMSVGAVLGSTVRTQLREMLLRRFGRNLTTLGPFLTGAAVAGYLNRRATRGLGDLIRADLRKQFRAIAGPPQIQLGAGPIRPDDPAG